MYLEVWKDEYKGSHVLHLLISYQMKVLKKVTFCSECCVVLSHLMY